MSMTHYIESAGLRLFPLTGKIPATKQDWTQDSVILPEGYTGNAGVALSAEFFVIDADPRNMPAGQNTLASFMRDCGMRRLNTLQVITGGGGLHIYFQKPADFKIKSKLHSYPGLDIKKLGGYVVAPGSIHPETKREYTIRVNAPIMKAPHSILSAIADIEAPEAIKAEGSESDYMLGTMRDRIANAKAPEEGTRNNTIYAWFCRCRDAGLSLEDAETLMLDFGMRCSPAVEERECQAIGQHAYRYAKMPMGCTNPENVFPEIIDSEHKDDSRETSESVRYDLDSKGGLKKTLRNAVNVLEDDPKIKGSLRFNYFANNISIFGRPVWAQSGDCLYSKGNVFPWVDAEAIGLKHYFSSKSFEVSTELWHEAALIAAKRYSFHPLREKLSGLLWDGEARVDSWLTQYCGAVPSKYAQIVGRKWLLGCVHRAFNPGCKMDYMLVLEGPQGPGKSKMCAELAMGFGGTVNMDAKAADIVQGMQGLWIIEMAEMAAYSKAAVADMKRFITEQKDRVRMAYARNTEDYPRQCAFIGTINPDECGYLKDNQNRRYWPVTVGQMDIERMRAEVEQLWAEVVVLFNQGEACYIEDRDLEAEVQGEIDKRKIQDSWSEAVIRFLSMPRGDDFSDEVNEWSIIDIYTGAIGGSIQQFTNFHRDRIVSIMLSLGWKKQEIMQGKTQIIKFVKY